MANKNITLKTEITKPESATYNIIVQGNTSLYLNDNVIFSDIDEVPTQTVSATRDIDFTQTNTFAIILTEDTTGTELSEQFRVILSPNGTDSYNVTFSMFDSVSPNTIISDYIVSKVSNINFKINDTILNTYSISGSDDVPLTHSSSINWNGSDQLSFEIIYRYSNSSTIYFEQTINYQQTHSLKLTLS